MDPVAIAAAGGLAVVAVTGIAITVFVLRRSLRRIDNPLPVVVQRDGVRVVEIPTRQASRTSRSLPFLALGRYTGTGLLRIVPGGLEVVGLREKFVPLDEIAEVDSAGWRPDYVALTMKRGRGHGFITASPQGTDAALLELAPYLPFTDLARERLAQVRPAG